MTSATQVGQGHLEAVLGLVDGQVAVIGGLLRDESHVASPPAERLLGVVLGKRTLPGLVDDLDQGALSALEAAGTVLAIASFM